MILIGLILLVLGAGLGTAAYIGARDETGTIQLTALGFTRAVPPLELFLIGAVAMLLFALGWAAVSGAMRRRARARRADRESERLAEVERSAESERLEHERRLGESGTRDEDLRRREDELGARRDELDARELELTRRENERRDREGPSVADVETGRAEGRGSEGTAAWANDTTPSEAGRHRTPRNDPGTRA